MGTFGRINPAVAAAGPALRSRASYLAMNAPFISNAVANWTGALMGPGIQPAARHPDAAVRKALNWYFAEWCSRADAEGRPCATWRGQPLSPLGNRLAGWMLTLCSDRQSMAQATSRTRSGASCPCRSNPGLPATASTSSQTPPRCLASNTPICLRPKVRRWLRAKAGTCWAWNTGLFWTSALARRLLESGGR